MARSRSWLIALLTGAALALAAVPATAKIQIGISEQNANVFPNKYFKALHMGYGRIVVPWNIASRKDYWPHYLSAWIAGAKTDHVEAHVAFGIEAFSPKYFGRGPTLGQYTKAVKAFRRRWPTVHVFSPWNEENHSFEPTAKHPLLALQYYKIVKRLCPSCKVLGADMLDDPNLTSWLRRFQGYARHYKVHPKIWGLHNYQDANHHRAFAKSWTYKLTKLVRGDIWSTEAGGMVGFKTVKGRLAYKYDVKRAARAQKYLFVLMGNRKVRARYKRVYIYDFFGTWSPTKRKGRWDSGLVGRDGKPRPAYYGLKKIIAGR